MAQQPIVGQGLLIIEASRSQTHNTRSKSSRPAFLKLWSADHKWYSDSALVVLLD